MGKGLVGRRERDIIERERKTAKQREWRRESECMRSRGTLASLLDSDFQSQSELCLLHGLSILQVQEGVQQTGVFATDNRDNWLVVAKAMT